MREAVASDFELPPVLRPKQDAYGLDVTHPATHAAFAQRRAEHAERNEEQRQIDLAAQRELERRMRAEEAGEL